MRLLGLPETFTNVGIIAQSANQLCTAHQAFCTGSNKQFTSKAACIAFMVTLPPPPIHRMAGNNMFCR